MIHKKKLTPVFIFHCSLKQLQVLLKEDPINEKNINHILKICSDRSSAYLKNGQDISKYDLDLDAMFDVDYLLHQAQFKSKPRPNILSNIMYRTTHYKEK